MNKKAVILGVLLLAAGGFALAAVRRQASGAAPGQGGGWAPEPGPLWLPDFTGLGDTVDYWVEQTYNEYQDTPMIETAPAPAPAHTGISPNVRAFINMLAACEGTLNAGGYAALYGSTPGNPKTFTGWADHPRLAQRISSTDQRWTSAAGLLQWMAISPIPGGGSTRVDTWDRIKQKLNLPDFSPDSQDRAAVQVFKDFGALADIEAGRVVEAARKLKSQWASLPGAGYGQGERTESYVVSKYTQAGGVLA